MNVSSRFRLEQQEGVMRCRLANVRSFSQEMLQMCRIIPTDVGAHNYNT